MIPPHVIQRLADHLEPTTDGCLVCTYSVGSHGYSQIGWCEDGRRVMRLGHRVAWEAVYGPIHDDLTIDHLCRNKRCCNIGHLRLLSNVDNARDNGEGRKTHCPLGHPYDAANTFHNRRGYRQCRACRKRWR